MILFLFCIKICVIFTLTLLCNFRAFYGESRIKILLSSVNIALITPQAISFSTVQMHKNSLCHPGSSVHFGTVHHECAHTLPQLHSFSFQYCSSVCSDSSEVATTVSGDLCHSRVFRPVWDGPPKTHPTTVQPPSRPTGCL